MISFVWKVQEFHSTLSARAAEPGELAMAVAVSRAPCEGGILELLLGLGSVSALGSASGDRLRWTEASRGGLAFLYDGVGIALYSMRALAVMPA